jgi:DNA-binding NarL/FixJ family response regulator
MIRILVVGDQPAIRQGLRMRLAAEPDICVVGEAADRESGLFLGTTLYPDIILIDVDMLHMDGIPLVKALHSVCHQVSIIIISMYDDAPTFKQAKKAGAAASVAKSLPADTLLATIRQFAH